MGRVVEVTKLEYHIVPREDRWYIRRDGAVIAIYDSRTAALRHACDRAQVMCGLQDKKRWTMVLHGVDGTVQNRTVVPC